MSDGILSVNLLFHDTILIHANRGEKIQDGLVHRLETVDDQRDSDSLPTRATFLCVLPPVFGLLRLADIADIQHDAMKSPCVKGLVFVIRSDSNQHISLPFPFLLTKRPPVRFGEIVWITCRGGVPHVPGNPVGVTGIYVIRE